MTDRETRVDGDKEPVRPEDESPEAGAAQGEPSTRPRRPWTWWAVRGLLGLVIAALLLVIAGFVVYDYGTMMPPTPEVQADYDTLVSQGKATPEPPAPGWRIPIPGCVCHAADADIAQKEPGHAPDPILVITHRYRTFSQCFTCHTRKGEASEGIVPGEPGNQPVIPAQ